MTIQGKWNVTIETPVGPKTGVMEFVVDGATLSGSLYDADHRVMISDGRIDGHKVTWSARITAPMRLSLKFSATVDGDRIEGRAKHLLGSAAFHGSRV